MGSVRGSAHRSREAFQLDMIFDTVLLVNKQRRATEDIIVTKLFISYERCEGILELRGGQCFL